MKELLTRNLDPVYDQYLAGRERDAVKAIQEFQERTEKSLLKFGRFTIPTFLKPHFIFPSQEKAVRSASAHVIGILNKVVDFCSRDTAFKDFYPLSREARELIDLDPGYRKNIVIARLDCLAEGDNLKIIEMNTGSPAGMGYADLLEQMFFETPELYEFFELHHIKRESRVEKLLEALLEAYREFGGGYETPNIAIVDWRSVRTRPEFEILREVFERKGFKTEIADPRDLRYKGKKLYCDDFRIDILYRRVVFGELVERLDEVSEMIRACRDRAVCMVNPFRSTLAGTKGAMSVLTNPAYDALFTEEENKVKRSYFPWTRRMRDAENFYGDRKIYLIDFLKDEKDTLVLKPSEGYGGKDVWIGAETKGEDWNVAIDRALKGDWVVQDFVPVPITTMPALANDRLDFLYKKITFSSFAFGEKMVQGFSRVGDESVIAVARNGGLIPCMGIEDITHR
ncbi:MAG TPA: hypothetical protein PKL97_02520 [Candidatus Omnitrophota bacterium]|nr:hypothetical protein [Candidatus Omnitrophota bacterium]